MTQEHTYYILLCLPSPPPVQCFELLTGRAPFRGSSVAEMQAAIRGRGRRREAPHLPAGGLLTCPSLLPLPVVPENPRLSEEARKFVADCLAMNPGERPSVDDLFDHCLILKHPGGRGFGPASRRLNRRRSKSDPNLGGPPGTPGSGTQQDMPLGAVLQPTPRQPSRFLMAELKSSPSTTSSSRTQAALLAGLSPASRAPGGLAPSAVPAGRSSSPPSIPAALLQQRGGGMGSNKASQASSLSSQVSRSPKSSTSMTTK